MPYLRLLALCGGNISIKCINQKIYPTPVLQRLFQRYALHEFYHVSFIRYILQCQRNIYIYIYVYVYILGTQYSRYCIDSSHKQLHKR